jgi:hypothetical protein
MEGALLSLSVVPFVHPPDLPAQRLRVLVNGNLVGDLRLRATSQVQFVIPPGGFGIDDTVAIEFHHPDAARPSRFPGTNGDTRNLAFLFEQLSLYAL